MPALIHDLATGHDATAKQSLLTQQPPHSVHASTNGLSSTNGHMNGHASIDHARTNGHKSKPDAGPLLKHFLDSHQSLDHICSSSASSVIIDGRSLSIAQVAAVARFGANVSLTTSSDVRSAVQSSRAVIESKVAGGKSVYGVSTGFGGSADTRTKETLVLGQALLQHQHAGVLPSSNSSPEVLPLLDPFATTSMPEAWVRGAMVVRLNSLIRGHSGVRWELIEKIAELLQHNITPLVPLRGSISASGDLSPLSYIAGSLVGNPSIRVWDGVGDARRPVRSSDALAAHKLAPLPLQSKEHLGILNGTAFSAATAALALQDSVHLALLAHVCTALGTEALVGTQGSFDAFISAVARPHSGQIESASLIHTLLNGSQLAQTEDEELSILEDQGLLRQDRYPLRTAPQFLGPQIEDILSALDMVTQECNSTTDNPLIDGTTGLVHHGGNFQAMHVTNAMEKTRLSLHHIGKLLFAQSTEILNPVMNRGLPPSLAATDPSHDYHCKGLDIATASYVSELGFLANPVSTHIQSAEMHNQAVNSLALISARKTIESIQVLSLLAASYIYVLCQAIDIRCMQAELTTQLDTIISAELETAFGTYFQDDDAKQKVFKGVRHAMDDSFKLTSTMDAAPRMSEIAGVGMRAATEHFAACEPRRDDVPFAALRSFRANVAARATEALHTLRKEYLSGGRGPAPGKHVLHATRPLYEFVRVTLGVRMHGEENLSNFSQGLGVQDLSIGEKVSAIYEAIRDGKMQDVVVSIFA